MAERRELILDLLARDKTGPAVKAFGRNLDDAAKSADRVKKGMGSLDSEIKGTEKEIRNLSLAFAETNDKAERFDLSKSIRKAQNDLRQLNSRKSSLAGFLPDVDDGTIKKWAKDLQTKVGSALADAGPLTIGAGVLGVALAPTIGAAIAGAVVGGVGIGGIIGGVALAAKDPAIAARAKGIGQTLSSGLQEAATKSFTGPINASLTQLEALVGRSVPKIGKIFDSVAPSLSGLTGSLSRAGDALLNSFTHAAAASGPVLKEIGNIIEDTGHSLAGFIDMAASHSKEGVSALEDFSGALQNMIKVSSTVVGALASIKGGLDHVDDALDKARYWLEDNSGILDFTADGYKKGSEAAELYRKKIIGVAGSANDYSHYLEAAKEKTDAIAAAHREAAAEARGEQSALAGLSKQVKAETDPVFALLNAEDNLATAQRGAAQATKEHGAKSREAKAALRNLAEAAIDLEGKAGALGNTFKGQVSPKLMSTLHAAGLTDDQIWRLGKQFRTAEGDGKRFARLYRASASVAGTGRASGELRTLREQARAYARVWTATMVTNFVTYGKPYSHPTPYNVGGLASGGVMERNTPYWVGENGPELVFPQERSRVISAAASRMNANAPNANPPRGGGGNGEVPTIHLAGNREIVALLRRLMRTSNLNMVSA